MKKYLPIFILFIILLLGFVTRFYLLGKAPEGLYLDEAGQGYNAYSILKTGKDEFGKSFPAAFRSFNDFKTPVYIYLIVPLIPIFGLNTFSIRLPSFVFSLFTLVLLYFLIIKIAGKSKWSVFIALFSTLYLSISPWHILFGRTNFECNVALFLMLFGYYLFLVGLKKPFVLLFSSFFFAIALPAYHSERLLVPLILIFLLIKYWKVITSPSHKLYSFLSFILGIILVFPTLRILATPGFMARVSTLNILSGSVVVHPGYLISYSGYFSWLVNSYWFLTVKEFFSQYFFYLSPRSLFWIGDSGPRSSFPELSVFFVWQTPLYLYGLYLLFKERSFLKLREFILLLLFISPIPAALTKDPFSTIRSLPLVIPISIILALATEKILLLLKTKPQRFVFGLIGFMIVVHSLLKLYSSGIILNEYYRAIYWDFGWEQVSTVIKSLNPSYPVVVDNARGEPYSQLLVFLKPDPKIYQLNNFEVTPQDYYIDMSRNTSKVIGQITTRAIDWVPDTKIEQYLVGDYLAISEEQILKNRLLLIKEIDYPDGSPAYRIVKTQPSKALKPL